MAQTVITYLLVAGAAAWVAWSVLLPKTAKRRCAPASRRKGRRRSARTAAANVARMAAATKAGQSGMRKSGYRFSRKSRSNLLESITSYDFG